MNYYEHHIRDYDTATSHLTWEEDLAYSRLLRWYYRKEIPIPADIKEACRQVRAVTKAQRDAVQTVLNEFFELREDGWHNETCDDVIAAYQSGEPEREAKKKNEETRLARHRKERADLFAIINAAGHHMAWNAPIGEVRALVNRINATPETPPATQPETGTATPATATQTPDTNTQILLLDTQTQDSNQYGAANSFGVMAGELIKLGVKVTSMHPTLQAWVTEGFTLDQAREAVRVARFNKPHPEPIPAKYLDTILRSPPRGERNQPNGGKFDPVAYVNQKTPGGHDHGRVIEHEN